MLPSLLRRSVFAFTLVALLAGFIWFLHLAWTLAHNPDGSSQPAAVGWVVPAEQSPATVTAAHPVLTSRGRAFTFSAHVSRAERRAFLAATRSATTSAQHWLRLIAAQVYVRTFTAARTVTSESFMSTARVHGRAYYILDINRHHLLGLSARARNELVLHELGHVVMFAGVTERGQHAFRRAWRTSRHWQRCFHPAGGGACADTSELFADQFAWFATGHAPTGQVGYGDPPLISRARTNQLLHRWFALMTVRARALTSDG